MKSRIIAFWNGMPSPERSGGDVYNARLIKVLNERGYTPDLVTAGGASILIKELDIHVNRLHNLDTATARNVFSISMLYVARTLKAVFLMLLNPRQKFDYAISASPYIYDILPAILCKSDTKVVVVFHILPRRHAENLLTAVRFKLAQGQQRFSLWLINRFFDTILVGNSDVEGFLKQRMKKKKIIIANAGIDINAIESSSTKSLAREDDVLFVGRLTQQKGIYDLIDVAKALSRQGRKLIIVGDGQDKGRLQQLIKDNKLKNIVLQGFVTQAEKYKLMKTIGVFVFPSYEEGWGISPAEALYCGQNVILYELSHYRSIFSDYPVYCPLGNKDRLSEAVSMAHVLKEPQERAQVEFMKQYDDVEVVKSVLDTIGLS